MATFNLMRVITNDSATEPDSLSQQLCQNVAQSCNQNKSLKAIESLPWPNQLKVAAYLDGPMLVQFFASKQSLPRLLQYQPIDLVQGILLQFFQELSSQQLCRLDQSTANALEDALLTTVIAFSLEEEVAYASQLLYLPIEQLPECTELITEEVVTLRDSNGHVVKRTRSRLQSYTDGVLDYFDSIRHPENRKRTRVDLFNFPSMLQNYILFHTYPSDRHMLSPEPLQPPLTPHELGLTTCDAHSSMHPKRAIALLSMAMETVSSGRAHVAILLLSWILIMKGFQSTVSTTRRFNVNVYHFLSIALGQFHVEFEIVWDCLKKMKDYSLFPSDQIETLLAKQSAMFHYGFYQAEDVIFNQLLHQQRVPGSSLLMASSLKQHMNCVFGDIEEIMLEMVLDLHHHSTCQEHCNGLQQRESSRKMIKSLDNLRANCYFIQSQYAVNPSLSELINNGLACAMVYEGAINIIQKKIIHARNCFKRALSLFRLSTKTDRSRVLNDLIRLKSTWSPPTVTEVEQNISLLEGLSQELDHTAHRKFSHPSCQILFTHLALFIALFDINDLTSTWLEHVIKAFKNMSRNRHVRIGLLQHVVSIKSNTLRRHQGVCDAPHTFLGQTQARSKMVLEEALREDLSNHTSDCQALLEYIKRDEGLMSDLYKFAFVSLQNYNYI